jgi:hypothetical protein
MAKRGHLYTYSGKLSFPGGAPSLFDMAVQLSRECRYAGAGMRWWPVALHTFVVCDLLPDHLKIHGLAHDTPETITGDVPKPVKTAKIEEFERDLLRSIYRKTFRIPQPTPAEHIILKKADTDVLCGEVYTVGTRKLQDEYPRCPQAEELVIKYLEQYPPLECINPDGRAPIEFMRRFRLYMDMWNAAKRRR